MRLTKPLHSMVSGALVVGEGCGSGWGEDFGLNTFI